MMVCLNGGRAWPATPAQLAKAAGECVPVGATSFHLHPRDALGRESLEQADVAAAVGAVREACPGVPVGVSTGLWITGGSVGEREELVGGWGGVLPDFASVNAGEDGFGSLVRKLHDSGVDVEAGIWGPAEVKAIEGLPVARVLVEVLNTPAGEAAGAAEAILGALDEAGWDGERLVHGEEEACWPLIAHAGRLGLATRIGLEDTLLLPDGRPAITNAALLRAARAMWTVGRRAAAK